MATAARAHDTGTDLDMEEAASAGGDRVATVEQGLYPGQPNTVGTENYARYRREHQLADFERTRRGQGIRPGREAPDFELEAATGERIRLGALRGQPVVLHFGSLT